MEPVNNQPNKDVLYYAIEQLKAGYFYPTSIIIFYPYNVHTYNTFIIRKKVKHGNKQPAQNHSG